MKYKDKLEKEEQDYEDKEKDQDEDDKEKEQDYKSKESDKITYENTLKLEKKLKN